jgi:hypothetical protein
MGVYSGNRTNLNDFDSNEIVANESYFGDVASFQMMMESTQNDQAIFDSIITNDFKEAASVHEGVELELVTEGAGEFMDKIKELIKKAWEKIKGMFKSFLTKFNSVIMRDNKAFVEKYKKEVLTKNLSKLKFKYSEPITSASPAGSLDDTYKLIRAGLAKVASNDLDKLTEDLDSGDYADSLYAEACSGSDSKTFNKDFHEMNFKDEEEVEGLESGVLSAMIAELTSSAKALTDLEKASKAVDKIFNDTLKEIGKLQNILVKAAPFKDDEGAASGTNHVVNKDSKGVEGHVQYTTKGSKENKEGSMKRANMSYKIVSIQQTVMTRMSAAILTETKFSIAQSRRVFAQAAAFNAKSIKEDAILIEAVGDAAQWEIMSSFNDYGM